MLTLIEAKNYIATMDLNSVVDRLVQSAQWDRRHAVKAMRQYKKFLYITKKYSAEYPMNPSYEIDEVWHAHILHTEQYHQDCEMLFGKYLHHRPMHGSDGDAEEKTNQEFEVLQGFFKKEFGDYLYDVIPRTRLEKFKYRVLRFSLRYFFRGFSARKKILQGV